MQVLGRVNIYNFTPKGRDIVFKIYQIYLHQSICWLEANQEGGIDKYKLHINNTKLQMKFSGKDI